MLLQPGLYLTDLSQCLYVFANIKKFKLSAYGASFQNISTTFNTAFFVAASPLRDGGANIYQEWLINQTTPGSTAFTMVTSTDAANLTPTSRRGARGYCSPACRFKVSGFPPNLHRFDYLKILSVTQYASASLLSATYTSGTGVFSLTFATAPFGAGVGTTLNGAFVPVSGLAGTGTNLASLMGTWRITSTASSGTVINLLAPFNLGAITISAARLGPLAR